jgi:hypothetical protein
MKDWPWLIFVQITFQIVFGQTDEAEFSVVFSAEICTEYGARTFLPPNHLAMTKPAITRLARQSTSYRETNEYQTEGSRGAVGGAASAISADTKGQYRNSTNAISAHSSMRSSPCHGIALLTPATTSMLDTVWAIPAGIMDFQRSVIHDRA